MRFFSPGQMWGVALEGVRRWIGLRGKRPDWDESIERGCARHRVTECSKDDVARGAKNSDGKTSPIDMRKACLPIGRWGGIRPSSRPSSCGGGGDGDGGDGGDDGASGDDGDAYALEPHRRWSCRGSAW
ncbi:hypothetical protein EN836_14105 [Mesorhizobium sp. M1C.F.Ca.ET.193.01.1.1]|nr:hypothetical protein EN853_14105 [Mesorhizobium sp. M1C.F.Ca.ET.210.01.1.1]TGQ71783.1 hypothetical protein EN855_014115 [Mesorhizobium sp. M1C.F.Ca.ET.212.01.1.1]TGR08524.1 hypothetical protein EN847_14105 [Mesorhizobium sp. M1C.F.Ca.ET.204.01.1.1]TGR28764.1 hypothetical protein EN839_14110 [Mesorhizobium sp. M1C.F.Ca.ET.196.01.1.1]TGR51287.1 hypothetical protein EN838_14105 [Mesorhizobium sp. M1C.F.Ca.ET.195.01.1.1]TGR65446.1 hypothetical protein EN835_014100 [Mesorhizobium sp. M1C.F.Ca.ET